MKPPLKLNVAEIAENFSIINEDNKEEQIKFLRMYSSYVFKKYLYMCYSSNVEFLLPKEINFVPSNLPSGMAQRNLAYEASKMYLYTKGGHPKLKQEKREALYESLLSGLPVEEAEFLENVRLRNLDKRYGLTLDIVTEAYPDLKKHIRRN